MAGLIGASNSPVSGVGILAVLGISLILVAHVRPPDRRRRDAEPGRLRLVRHRDRFRRRDDRQRQSAGPQDRPTGRRDAVAAAGGADHRRASSARWSSRRSSTSSTTPSASRARRAPGPNALAAPQAALISAIAQGVLGGNLDWSLIGLGAADRRRRDHRRRSAARDRASATPAAARRRHGHLSADGADPADPGRRVDRLVLRQVGRARGPTRRSPSGSAC